MNLYWYLAGRLSSQLGTTQHIYIDVWKGSAAMDRLTLDRLTFQSQGHVHLTRPTLGALREASVKSANTSANSLCSLG